MIGYDYYERLACGYCGSEFDDQWTEDYKHLSEAKCPVCTEVGFLYHKFQMQCPKCDYTLGITKHDAWLFKRTHSSGNCYPNNGENYYFKDGEFYCQECWDKMTD